ncbi:MAG: class I tRNA ligase family protein [Streptosporangiaceae bacterium]
MTPESGLGAGDLAPGIPPGAPDLAAIDSRIRTWWAEREVTTRWVGHRAGRPAWIGLDGPAPGYGLPGLHQVPVRATADLYRRFQVMRGYRAPASSGWDCHGLPVEIAVQRELGLAGLAGIESYGMEEFVARCREFAERHIDAAARLDSRLGRWPDASAGGRPMDRPGIEAVWRSLRPSFDSGVLTRRTRVRPYCPRCRTVLSDPELGLPGARRTGPGIAATVRFRLLSAPRAEDHRLDGADLLVSTTAAWTLPATVAVAAHPDASYVLARLAGQDDRVIVAEDGFARILGPGWHVAARMTGADLVGAGYRPPDGTACSGGDRVITGRFVRPETGTGLTHLVPAHSSADESVCAAVALPGGTPIGPDGRFDRSVPAVAGLFFADAEQALIGSLSDRGLLFASGPARLAGPGCPRCGGPALPYPTPAWEIRLDQDRLRTAYQRARWLPAGDHGDTAWLSRTGYWALSRGRYWGTPLPVWECTAGHRTWVDSLAALSALAGADLTRIDPHRPQLDRVIITCPECGASGYRVADLIDAWYETAALAMGALPDHSEHAGDPHLTESAEQVRARGYALMATGLLASGRPAFGTVLRVGPVLAGRGRVMGREHGNIIDPLPVLDRYGADAARWLFASAQPPWTAARIRPAAFYDVVRKVLTPYWNTAAFWTWHAGPGSPAGTAETARGAQSSGAQSTAAQSPAAQSPAAQSPAPAYPLDRWLISRLHAVIGEVTSALDAFDPVTATRLLTSLTDDLSRWYLRRSRRRYLACADAGDTAAASATLRDSLRALTAMMAPIAPFITEYVWARIRVPSDPESVHLADWPTARPELIDGGLEARMAEVRRICSLGRAARARARIGIRQPLSRALVDAGHLDLAGPELAALIAADLNVRAIEPLPAGQALPTGGLVWAGRDDAAVAIDPAITADLRGDGIARQFIRQVQHARGVAGLSPGEPIDLGWRSADPDVAAALGERADLIAAEVRAAGLHAAARPGADADEHVINDPSLSFWLVPRPA